MKNIKNKKLVIICIVAILLGLSTTITKTIKKDLNKSQNNNEIKEDVSNDEIKDNEKDDSKIDIIGEENKDAENKITSDNLDKQNNNTPENNNINGTNKSEIETNPEVKTEEPSTEEDKNDINRKVIETTYNIKILYGDEIDNYSPKGITPVRLIDSNEIENYLNRLNIELAKYPKGFFNDFNKKGMPLTIYLVKSANGVFSGFTDYQFMNDIKLTLATDYNFEYTLHHELMHYIDCYLDIVMYPNNPYSDYEVLNPSGFIYGNATSTQIYNMASNQKGAYFVSSYASTHVKEDRAEVFKYMMARAYKPIGCFEPNEIIRKKAEIISNQIKTYFPSVIDISHWDRFIS